MNTASKSESWKDVRCASLPLDALGALADLRGLAAIRVALAGERAWICWPADGAPGPELLARRILSLRSAELFTERGGEWYQLGARLPSFRVPFRSGAAGMPLEQLVVPGKLTVLRPVDSVSAPVRIRLVRDPQERVRPATALRCAIAVLASWADRATSAELVALQAVWREATDGEERDAEVLVVGPPGKLPLLPASVGYWGTRLLLPLGFRAEPDLPEAAIRSAAGAGQGDLAVLDQGGLELVAQELFVPLTRAAVRLAQGAAVGPGPEQGSRS